jgi:hypothetical protein
VVGYKQYGIKGSANFCEITANAAGATAALAANTNTVLGCHIHDNTCKGIESGGTATIIGNLICNNGGESSDGITFNSYGAVSLVANNTIYNNGRDGIRFSSYPFGCYAVNNLLASNAGWGITCVGSGQSWYADHNSYWQNTLGRRSIPGDDDIILSANPFVNASLNDFRPNTAAGGGALLRAAGIGVYGQTDKRDIGAVQHADPVVTYAAASNVRSGTDRGDGTLGTLAVPAASHVRAGVAVDAGVGTCVVPAAADVRAGVAVDHTIGALVLPTLPSPNDVRAGVDRGDGTAGTIALPAPGEVLAGVGYGAGGNELLGTLQAGGCDDPDAVIQRAGGNYVESHASDLRLGIIVGAGAYTVAGSLRPYPEAPAEVADNTLVALRALILDRDDVVALVDTRVYCQCLPSADRSILPCIQLFRLPGKDNPDIPSVSFPRYDVRCFGASQMEAQQVYTALKGLDGQVRLEAGGYFFHYLEEVSSGQDTFQQHSDASVFDCVQSQWAAEISRA